MKCIHHQKEGVELQASSDSMMLSEKVKAKSYLITKLKEKFKLP